MPASAHVCFLPLLWCCHSEVHLSGEKPAALVELAVVYLDLVGGLAMRLTPWD